MAEKLKWIEINEKILEGVQKLNTLTTFQFIDLLTHIRDCKNPLRELDQLSSSINWPVNELNYIVQCLMVIYKESQRVILKPTDLQSQLVDNLKLTSDKAEEFVKVWSVDVRNKFGDFENKLKLTNISWELNLETASTFSTNDTIPTGRIQLELSNFNENKVEDIVTLENLDEQSLVHLYNTLEVIQKKLDIVNS